MTAYAFEERPETAHGRLLFQTLLAIHAMLRRDLAAVQRLAVAVVAGLPASGVREGFEALTRDGMLWQFLRVACATAASFTSIISWKIRTSSTSSRKPIQKSERSSTA